ncbi:MAG: UDP-N-acetylmuramoyl-L-alanyl-D-glutamate--2,6-diaminopimelate ligase [Candidatus Omnitrophota bacterium]
MLASEIIKLLKIKPQAKNFVDFEVKGISIDSRNVANDFCFIAQDGTKTNGYEFIQAAIEKGARLIIYPEFYPEPKINSLELAKKTIFLKTDNLRKVTGLIAAEFFQRPSRNLQMIGVTGTNGKTTVTFFIEHLLKKNQIKTGMISTVYYKIDDHIIDATHTTPDAIKLQQLFFNMINHNISHCVMEVSSHALDQKRVSEIDFQCAVFTNLSQDHLDYHVDMENYFKTKAQLFKRLSKNSFAVINTDDPCGIRLKKITQAKIIGYAVMDKNATVRAQNIVFDLNSTTFDIITPAGILPVKTKFIGRYNIYNILACICVGLAQNIELNSIVKAIQTMDSVPGRLERLSNNNIFEIFVDYAHTDDALTKVLTTLKELKPHKIITVFGCGGNRDTKKRPLMGKAASLLSDFLILTNDNPRNENPEKIIADIQSGFEVSFKNFEVILDRKKAIEKAITRAQQDDFILVAGKGHENYQIFGDKKIDFDDRKIIKDLLLTSPKLTLGE